MDAFRIVGGTRLDGAVRVPGAKNSVLKLMAAGLLAEGTCTLLDVPDILDVRIMAELLNRLGCEATYEADRGLLTLTVPADPGHRADYDLVRAMRASISVLGPLVARSGSAEVALPGGDAIGSRGLDMHVEGLQALGAEIDLTHGYLVARAPKGLTGNDIRLDFPSVGATENLLMASVLATGRTVLDNVAREPEVVDLCQMLRRMGARIEGVGSATLEIEGVEGLRAVEHRVVPDRIVAGTWAFAAALTGGDIEIHNGEPGHLELVLSKLTDAGAQVSDAADGFRVVGPERPVRPRSVDVATLPYPGFPTDLQPFMVALMSVADGASMVTENLFEARFRFVHEIARLGAQVRIDGHHAYVRGVRGLSGAPVEASDIRAGAALVLAGLIAEGETVVYEAQHIDRGYAGMEVSLRALGADVQRL